MYLENIPVAKSREKSHLLPELLLDLRSHQAIVRPIGLRDHLHGHSLILVHPVVKPTIGTRGELRPEIQIRQIHRMLIRHRRRVNPSLPSHQQEVEGETPSRPARQESLPPEVGGGTTHQRRETAAASPA